MRHSPLYNRLQRIVQKYPAETKVILERMGIADNPSPETLLIAYAKDKTRLLDYLMDLRPVSFTEDANWWEAREAARIHNALVSTKQIDPLFQLGAQQIPVSWNPELGKGGQFYGSEYFKAPLKRFSDDSKGTVSSTPTIGTDSPLKREIITGEIEEEDANSEEVEPIPKSRQVLGEFMDTLLTGFQQSPLGAVLDQAEAEGREEELKRAKMEQQLENELAKPMPEPVKAGFGLKADNFAIFIIILVCVMVASFFAGSQAQSK